MKIKLDNKEYTFSEMELLLVSLVLAVIPAGAAYLAYFLIKTVIAWF